MRPFLYNNLVEQIESGARTWQRVLIWGARGLGKTTFLEILRTELGRYSGEAIQFVRGKNERARESFEGWLSNPNGTILVDDFERFYDYAIEKKLLSLPEDADRAWRLVLAVRSLSAIEAQSRWQLASPWINTFQRVRLEPWLGLWESRVKVAVKDALDDAQRDRRYAKSLSAFLDSSQAAALDSWLMGIAKVTGGHPSLVGSAFDGFLRLFDDTLGQLSYADRRLLEVPAKDLPGWQDAIVEYLEDYVQDNETIVRRVIVSFRDDPNIEHLIRLAIGQYEPKSPVVRHWLRDSGLVYRHHESGRLVVASRLTAENILAVGRARPGRASLEKQAEVPEQRERSVEVELVGDETSPESRGTLQYRSEDDSGRDLGLIGGSWRILRCLAEQRDEPIGVQALAARAGLRSEAATRSALQRLQRRLGEEGLDAAVVNVHGHGYRLAHWIKIKGRGQGLRETPARNEEIVLARPPDSRVMKTQRRSSESKTGDEARLGVDKDPKSA